MFFVLWFGGHLLAIAAVPLLIVLLARPQHTVLVGGLVGAALGLLTLALITVAADWRPAGAYYGLSWVIAGLAGFSGVGWPLAALAWLDRQMLDGTAGG